MLDGLQAIWNTTIEDYRMTLGDPEDYCVIRANLFGINLEKAGFDPLRIATKYGNVMTDIDFFREKSNTLCSKVIVWRHHIVCGVKDKDSGIIVFDPILFNGPEILENWRKTLFFYDNDKKLKNKDIQIRKFREVETCFFDNLDVFYDEFKKVSPIKKTKNIYLQRASSLSR